MKALILSLCLMSTVAFAQAPVRSPGGGSHGAHELGDALPENYVLKLTVRENDQQLTELSIVLATSQFRADTIDPTMTFAGTLGPEEGGAMLIRYTLGTEIAVPTQITTTPAASGKPVVNTSSIQYKTSSVQAGVRLRIGESVQILKSGSRLYQLTVSRLVEAAPGK